MFDNAGVRSEHLAVLPDPTDHDFWTRSRQHGEADQGPGGEAVEGHTATLTGQQEDIFKWPVFVYYNICLLTAFLGPTLHGLKPPIAGLVSSVFRTHRHSQPPLGDIF